MPIDKVWFTPAEAAEYLSTTQRVLTQLRYERTGPAYSHPRHKTIRYHLDDLDGWLRLHRVETNAS